jgi:peptidylprolyl isomerase
MLRYGLRWLAIATFVVTSHAVADEVPLTMAGVLEASSESDWKTVTQDRLLYVFLDSGVVVFELAPEFAAQHVANVRKLAGEGYWDGLAVLRSQDNYVVQWGDPEASSAAARSLGSAARRINGEYYRDLEGLVYTPIDSVDAYADTVGFVDGFPAGSDGERIWLAHCYGMLGAGRGNEPDSGSGAELYVVTGHAPRHLDRNVTLLGRALHGLELLSSLPRGTGSLGFYTEAGELVPLRRVRLGSELKSDEQLNIQRLRTDTPAFAQLVDARRNRMEEWFIDPAGRIGLCNVPLPVRMVN